MAPEARQLKHISVQGVVQGVGFRPTVWRLARELGLTGFVRNSSAGVEIEGRRTSPAEREGDVGGAQDVLGDRYPGYRARGRRQIAASTNQIQDGIGFFAVVSRRGVHVKLTLAIGYIGMIDVTRYIAMRYIFCIVISRAIAMHNQLAVWWHGGKASNSVIGVGDLNSVHIKIIDIHIRSERTNCQSPHSVFALLEGYRSSR